MDREDSTHPVNEMLPAFKLVTLGLQHVLVMYASAITIPLIIGAALKLSKPDIALLVSADLFTCGIVTILQSAGIGRVGIRMPVIMGVTFIAVGPMLANRGNPELGLLGIFGAAMVAGIVGFLIAPIMGRLMPFFPSVVTGIVILMIGISLMRRRHRLGRRRAQQSQIWQSACTWACRACCSASCSPSLVGAEALSSNLAVLIGIVVGFFAGDSIGRGQFRRSRSKPAGSGS